MACPEFEDLILDYCEQAAAPADRALLESHVSACPDCRAYLEMQHELDFRLSRAIVQPALSPHFKLALASRIAAQPRALRFRRLPRILDWIGYLSLTYAAGSLLQQLPHSGIWIGLAALTASAVFSLRETGKALRASFLHR